MQGLGAGAGRRCCRTARTPAKRPQGHRSARRRLGRAGVPDAIVPIDVRDAGQTAPTRHAGKPSRHPTPAKRRILAILESGAGPANRRQAGPSPPRGPVRPAPPSPGSPYQAVVFRRPSLSPWPLDSNRRGMTKRGRPTVAPGDAGALTGRSSRAVGHRPDRPRPTCPPEPPRTNRLRVRADRGGQRRVLRATRARLRRQPPAPSGPPRPRSVRGPQTRRGRGARGIRRGLSLVTRARLLESLTRPRLRRRSGSEPRPGCRGRRV